MLLNRSIKKAGTLIKAGAVFLVLALILIFISSCAGPVFVSGASFGYYIWEDKEENIHIAWSADRKDNKFDGKVSTDGIILSYELSGFEEDDVFKISAEKKAFDFAATLSADDYSDEIVFYPQDYNYIEFELKINDAYDLSRTNLGRFLNSPSEGKFRIDKEYFEKVDEIPFYKVPPFEGFLRKLEADMRFTMFYLFILGVIAIEIIRITVLRKKGDIVVTCFYVMVSLLLLRSEYSFF